jgi:hypothetical protein
MVQDFTPLRTWRDFNSHFPNTKSCQEFLINLKWPEGYVCGKCGSRDYWLIDGLVWCKRCKQKKSIKAGTAFGGSRLPLLNVFKIIWLFANDRIKLDAIDNKYHNLKPFRLKIRKKRPTINATRIKLFLNKTGLKSSYKAVWACLHRIRRAIRPSEIIFQIVDVDEVYVQTYSFRDGKPIGNRALVLILVENTSEKLVARAIRPPGAELLQVFLNLDHARNKGFYTPHTGENQDTDNLEGMKLVSVRGGLKPVSENEIDQCEKHAAFEINRLLLNYVFPGAFVKSDAWYRKPYFNLSRYKLHTVREEWHIGQNLIPFCVKPAEEMKNWLKRQYKGGFSQEHIDTYLDEFCFKYNNQDRLRSGLLFYDVIKAMINAEELKYKDIIKKIKSNNETPSDNQHNERSKNGYRYA